MNFKSNARHGQPPETGTIFKTKIDSLDVTIHRIIHYDKWYISCPQLMICDRNLKSGTIREAIEESKEVLRTKLETLAKSVMAYHDDPDIEITRW